MNEYKIITDSSNDLPVELLKEKDVTFIPYYVSFDQEHYQKEHLDLAIPDFYDKLVSSEIFPKTSLPAIEDFISTFEPLVQQGIGILYLSLTSKFSGAYQAAVTAKGILEEDYPDAKIEIVDSKLATSVLGLLVLEAVKMRDAGYSLEDNVATIDKIKETAKIMFTVGTLEYLQKGGRIGKVTALAGNLLNLKPLIVLKEGELYPFDKVRGKKKSFAAILNMTKEFFAKENESYDDYEFCTTSGTIKADQEQIQQSLEEEIGRKITVPYCTIGCTIGTYTGPETVGICFIKRYDRV